jgi:hypothetical protein
MVENKLKQNIPTILFLMILGLVLYNVHVGVAATIGSLFLIDTYVGFRSKVIHEYNLNGYSWKYWGYSAIGAILIFAALLLFKHYT